MKLKTIIYTILLTGIFLLALGIPTVVIPNSWFIRMTPVYWFDYIYLVLDSVLLAVYFALIFEKRKSLPKKSSEGKAASGGILGFLAVACPICNKILIWIFGATWLLQYFEPIRPIVGLFSVAILIWAIWSLQKPAYCTAKERVDIR